MRFATYNVEWFTNLFDDHDNMLEDGDWSGRQDVTRAEQLTALGIVFTALNADAVLVVDEGRRTGGIGEQIVTELLEALPASPLLSRIARIAGRDSFVPLADAANLVLLQEDDIVAAARRLLG